ncbi:MAG: 1-acyl-sn-glycerol-3-phosphate acyltransferase [Bryobacterales bacterium]|nr:1-acyl-sn-glycerol-3-phosphate acyltransferase [Bryobacterales bacterium]
MGLILRNIFISYPGSILSTLFFGLLSLLVAPFASTGRTQHAIMRMWANCVLWVCGIKVKVEGAENIPPGGSFVLVANHRSYMDSPIVIPFINLQFRFFAKSSVFYWPMIGYHLKQAGHLPVHYDNPGKSLKSMSAAADVIRQKGISVLLFPEAGRTTGELESFKDGAAYVAIKAGVPVIPMGITGAGQVLGVGKLAIRPGHITIRMGRPIPTIDIPLSERGRLTQTLWVRVAELIGYPVPADKREQQLVTTGA